MPGKLKNSMCTDRYQYYSLAEKKIKFFSAKGNYYQPPLDIVGWGGEGREGREAMVSVEPGYPRGRDGKVTGLAGKNSSVNL
jgi:hypothetical protein